MVKIRIVGPRPLLPAVVGLLQDAGDVHIESRPRDLHEVESEIPVIRRHIVTGDALRIREILESALDKVRKLLLVLPPAPGRNGAGPGEEFVPPPLSGNEASLRGHLAPLDSVALRVETFLGERKRLEDEIFHRQPVSRIAGERHHGA